MTENEQIEEMHCEFENWHDTQTNLTLAEWMYAKGYRKVERGEWRKVYKSGITAKEGWVSSCCDKWNKSKSDFCPYCGADMRGEDDV